MSEAFDPEFRAESATVMFVDVVESVRLIAQDEVGSVVQIRRLLKDLGGRVVPSHGGTLIEGRGDGFIATFADPRDAALCAHRLHAEASREGECLDVGSRIVLRVGLHRAEFMADDQSIYGRGVNLAARVAALAGPGETVVSSEVRDGLTVGLDAEVEDLGDCFLKHVPDPVRLFRLNAPDRTLGHRKSGQESEPTMPAIAVIPFSTHGTDPAFASVGELLAETLIHAIARAGGIRVISWLSSRVFRDRQESAPEIGVALGADWLLTGTCRVLGGRLIASAELSFARTGVVEYSERLVYDVEDLLKPESELAGHLAQVAVRRIMDAEARRVAKHELPSLGSHSLLLGAVGLMHRSSVEGFDRSRQALEYLLDRHPRMHGARPWLAKWYLLLTTRGFARAEASDAARALDQTARALDAQAEDAFALAVRGFIHFHMLRDADAARGFLDLSLDVNPNEPLACIFQAAVLGTQGHSDRAWEFANRALALSPFDPLRPYMRMIAASCALSANRFDDAAVMGRLSVKENAAHPAAWRALVVALVQIGALEEARRAVPSLLRLEPDLTVRAYGARLKLPPEARRLAVESLAAAGVPLE